MIHEYYGAAAHCRQTTAALRSRQNRCLPTRARKTPVSSLNRCRYPDSFAASVAEFADGAPDVGRSRWSSRGTNVSQATRCEDVAHAWPVSQQRGAEIPSTIGNRRATQSDRAAEVSTDEELIAAMAAGDRVALERLYRRHAPWIAGRLSTLTSSRDLAEEALQDTFVSAWRGARHYRAEGPVGAWLWGIARRRLVSLARRRPGRCPRRGTSSRLVRRRSPSRTRRRRGCAWPWPDFRSTSAQRSRPSCSRVDPWRRSQPLLASPAARLDPGDRWPRSCRSPEGRPALVAARYRR